MHESLRRLLFVAPVLGLTGCEQLMGLLGLDALSMLGVTPAEGYSDPSSADYGRFFVAIGARSERSGFIAPAVSQLDISTGGDPLLVEASEKRAGADQGSMLVLVDESSSLIGTDPLGYRKKAVEMLAKELSDCGKGWRMSLRGFDGDGVRVLEPWTADLAVIEGAADRLENGGSTNLYDAVIETIPLVEDDLSTSFADGGAPGGALVVISDGADSSSSATVEQMTRKASNSEAPIHTIGLGPAADNGGSADIELVRVLRDVSDVSAGVYGAASDPLRLPGIARAIAGAHCGGYTVLMVQDDDPGASGSLVDGRVDIAGTQLGAPFSFLAP